MRAWDLIGFDGRDGSVRIKGGRALYESVDYNDTTPGEQVRLSRLDQVKCDDGRWRLRQVDRYVAPDTILEVVPDRQ
jgi:hypothetical protein